MLDDTKMLLEQWTKAKQAEENAKMERYKIEEMVLKTLSIDSNLDGTANLSFGRYNLKIIGRINRKVDAEKIQELAEEHGLSPYLSTLLRWKPEVNVTAWKAADESVTRVLADAVTTSAGRPSFSISMEQ